MASDWWEKGNEALGNLQLVINELGEMSEAFYTIGNTAMYQKLAYQVELLSNVGRKLKSALRSANQELYDNVRDSTGLMLVTMLHKADDTDGRE